MTPDEILALEGRRDERERIVGVLRGMQAEAGPITRHIVEEAIRRIEEDHAPDRG